MCAIACGAGIGLKSVIDTLGGKITVLGTPAEEGGGGKITMLENGAFEGLDFAMLTHASADTCVNDISYSRTDIRVHYYGKTAHAATWPEEGISALTPILELFNIVNAMRLELGDKGKILGIIRDGGDQAIFIPDHCSAEFTIRSFSMKYKWELFHRFIKICENVAAITGTRFEYEMIDLSYEDIRNNPVLEDTLAENFKVLGEELCPRLKEQGIGCTDMGNVTHALPGCPLARRRDGAARGAEGRDRRAVRPACRPHPRRGNGLQLPGVRSSCQLARRPPVARAVCGQDMPRQGCGKPHTRYRTASPRSASRGAAPGGRLQRPGAIRSHRRAGRSLPFPGGVWRPRFSRRPGAFL